MIMKYFLSILLYCLIVFSCTEDTYMSNPLDKIAYSTEYRNFQLANSKVAALIQTDLYQSEIRAYKRTLSAHSNLNLQVCDDKPFPVSNFIKELNTLQCNRYNTLKQLRTAFPAYSKLSQEERTKVALTAIRANGGVEKLYPHPTIHPQNIQQ